MPPRDTPTTARTAPARDRPRRDSSWVFNLGAEIYGWFTNQAVWRASCGRMARHLPERRGLLVLDLGCGPGVSAIELARLRPDARIVGLDVARRMVTEAARRVRSSGVPPGRVRLVVGDGTRLPFPSGVADAVTGHSYLYLLPNRDAALSECLRVLRSGGRLILMEPDARPATLRGVLRLSRSPRHLLAVTLWRPFSRFHGRFTPTTLAATLRRAGFVECHVEHVVGGLGLLASATKP